MLSREHSQNRSNIYEVVYSRNWLNDVYASLKIKAGPDFDKGIGSGVVIRGNRFKQPGQIIHAYEVAGSVRKCRLLW